MRKGDNTAAPNEMGENVMQQSTKQQMLPSKHRRRRQRMLRFGRWGLNKKDVRSVAVGITLSVMLGIAGRTTIVLDSDSVSRAEPLMLRIPAWKAAMCVAVVLAVALGVWTGRWWAGAMERHERRMKRRQSKRRRAERRAAQQRQADEWAEYIDG